MDRFQRIIFQNTLYCSISLDDTRKVELIQLILILAVLNLALLILIVLVLVVLTLNLLIFIGTRSVRHFVIPIHRQCFCPFL